MFAQQVTQCYPVLSSQRMIGHKRTQSLLGQVFQPFYLQLDIQEIHACSQKLDSSLIFHASQETVYFILMDNPLQVRHQETGTYPAFFPLSLSIFYQCLLKKSIFPPLLHSRFLCKCNFSFVKLLTIEQENMANNEKNNKWKPQMPENCTTSYPCVHTSLILHIRYQDLLITSSKIFDKPYMSFATKCVILPAHRIIRRKR